MKLKDQIQALKSKIDESKSIPDPDLIWGQIEKDMNKSRKRRTIYLIAFLALLIGSVFYWNAGNKISKEITSAKAVKSETPNSDMRKEKSITNTKKTDFQKNKNISQNNLEVTNNENKESEIKDKTEVTKSVIEQINNSENIKETDWNNGDFSNEIPITTRFIETLNTSGNILYSDSTDQAGLISIDKKESTADHVAIDTTIGIKAENNDSLTPKLTNIIKQPDKDEKTTKRKKQINSSDNWKIYSFAAIQFNQLKPYSINNDHAIGTYFSNYSLGLAFQKKLTKKTTIESKLAFAMLPVKVTVEFVNSDNMQTEKSANLINMQSADIGINILRKLNQSISLNAGTRINIRTNRYHFIENLLLTSKTPEIRTQKLPDVENAGVLRRYYLSLNIGLNKEYKRFLFGFNYTQGLLDVSLKSKSFNPISYCQLSCGYRLF